MYELLEHGEKQDQRSFSVQPGGPDARVLDKMVILGLLEETTGDYDERTLRASAAGLRRLAQARAAGVPYITLHQETRPIHFHQTVNGTANTQVGDHNTMHVTVGTRQPEQVLAQLAELRALAARLPEDDQDEALSTIERAETAVKKGAWERVSTYGPVLLGLGTSTVEFAEKVKGLFGL